MKRLIVLAVFLALTDTLLAAVIHLNGEIHTYKNATRAGAVGGRIASRRARGRGVS